MKYIFITEKPSVAREYEKVLQINATSKQNGFIEGFSPVLSKDVIITWAYGHLIKISEPEDQNKNWSNTNWTIEQLPMIPDVYNYEPYKDKMEQFNIIKSLYTRKDIDTIYYAGDSGREGIYIQALIRNQIFKANPNCKEKVVWLNNQTEQEILRGIREAKPYSDYQCMINSGYARAMSDWLIGMNLTRAFTLTSHKLVNTGRVMTPTLAMIVSRQQAIDSFNKTPYFGIKANEKANWKAVKESHFFESPRLYNENGFANIEDAQNLVNILSRDMRLRVEDVKVQTKTEYAPYLFNLADLQAYCSKAYKITPTQALDIVQSLYEKKLTSYPRTDSRFLSSAVAQELKSHGKNIPDRYVDDSKVTDHYAIIPTLQGNPTSLTGLEEKVYKVILKRFEDTMKPPFIYDAVSIKYLHTSGEYFFESFRKVKQYGFKSNEEECEDEITQIKEDEEISDKPIPNKFDIISVSKFEIKSMETTPPKPYTTGSIILAMEKAGKLIEDEELREQIKTCGIGTSATRGSIIEKLIEKKFISVDKKQKISPTEFGKAVIPIIERFDSTLISPIKTADMEAHLEAIVQNELSISEYMSSINEYVEETTRRILENNTYDLSGYANGNSGNSYNCPCCNNVLKYGRYGWYCDCKFSLNLEICGHKMTETDLKSIINNGKTKAHKFKSKAGKDFKACLVLDKETKRLTFEFENSNEANNTSKSGWGNQNNTSSNAKVSQAKSSSNSPSKQAGSWGQSSTNSASPTTKKWGSSNNSSSQNQSSSQAKWGSNSQSAPSQTAKAWGKPNPNSQPNSSNSSKGSWGQTSTNNKSNWNNGWGKK